MTELSVATTDRAGAPTILDLLKLEPRGADVFEASVLTRDPRALYGGQVAAQALRAAGATAPPDRAPHSMHCYYLRPGDPHQPVSLRVTRDRDGRSFSSRRVQADQEGRAILSMSVSFQALSDGPDRQAELRPAPAHPADLPVFIHPRLVSTDVRIPEQSFPDLDFPTRLWARCDIDLPENPLIHACVLTYLTDMATGLVAWQRGSWRVGSSLDHAVWFHRRATLGDWMLLDFVPRTVAGGRGWYIGEVRDIDNLLLASVAQESLFRVAVRTVDNA
jgi:acyl-CoA thioesterase-2